jgi:acyl carrier protein
MTRDEIRAAVLAALAGVAPEADLCQLDPCANFRDQLDIDSVDFLNFVVALHKKLGVQIPEAEYSKLVSLESCETYLGKAVPS